MAADRTSSLVDFEDFFAIPKMFFKAIGMAPYKDESTTAHKTKMEVFLFSIALLNSVLAIWVNTMDSLTQTLRELTASLSCFTFLLLAPIKIYNIWSNRAKVDSFIRLMKQQFPKSKEEQAAFDVDNSLKVIIRIEKLYVLTLMLCLWSFNLLSLSKSVIEYLMDSSNGFAMRLPYCNWYPYKIDNIWVYLATYVQQSHAGIVASICFLAADIFLFSVISIILMYFRYIQTQLRAMTVKGHDGDLVNLRIIINFHQVTLNVVDLTNTVFSTTLLLTFMSSIVIICLSAFQSTAQDVPVIQLISHFIFLLYELVQTGAICNLGQMLMDYVSF